MPKYLVTISRTETIIFEIEAESAEVAEATYLAEGDEIGSDTTDLTILHTVEV